MLPKLPETDVMSAVPDVSGVDIWSDGFSKNCVPEGIGVYCFYEPDTDTPIYIGSACASPQPWNGTGLWLRIREYRYKRRSRNDKTERLGQIVRDRHLLLRVWLTQTEGDAHKYETDAIARHQPELNIKNAGHVSFEEKQIASELQTEPSASGVSSASSMSPMPSADALGPAEKSKSAEISADTPV